MYCKNCGKEINDNAAVCLHCGAAVSSDAENKNAPVYHNVPKCKKCGYVGEPEVEPLFRTKDWIIGLILLLFCGLGVIYFIIVGIMRSDKKKREKCPQCGSVDTMRDMY